MNKHYYFSFKPIKSFLLFLIFVTTACYLNAQIKCPSYTGYNNGNGQTNNCYLTRTDNSGYTKKAGDFTFSTTTALTVTKVFINGNQTQDVSNIVNGSKFFFYDLSTAGVLCYYSSSSSNNLTSGTYTFNFTDGTNNAVCNYTFSSSGTLSNLTAGSIGYTQSICSNSTPSAISQISSTTGGTSPYTYQWQSSTDGVTFSNVSSGGTSTSYSPAALTTTTYYQLLVTDNTGLQAVTNIDTIKVGSGVWLGTSSNDFTTASNWCGGTAPTNSSDVVIPASSHQPIISSGAVTFNSLTIQNGAILTVTGGTLTTNNGITVKHGGALVGSASNITGNLTLQENITSQRGWRMFANPFSAVQTLSTVASNNNISIQTTGSSNASGIADDRIWNNSTNAWADGGTSIAANNPYGLFIRGLSNEVTGLNYSGGPTDFTYSVSGTLNSNSVNISASNTSGNFLLVGNPYAAPIKSSALTNGTGISYYIYQISQGSTQTAQRTKAGGWSAVLSSSDATTIPILGVIAYQPTSSSYSISTSGINTSGTLQTGLFGNDNAIQYIELQVEQNGSFQDKLFIRLDEDATNNGTDKKDLKKFYNDNVNVYAKSGDKTDLAIDARNVLNTIPIGISGTIGDYNFKLANNSLPKGIILYLKDKYLNIKTELNIGDNYSYSINADTASKGENRFELIFSNKKTNVIISDNDTTTNNKLQATVLGNVTNNNSVILSISGAEKPLSVNIYNISGQKLNTQTATNGIQYINIGNTASGVLILKVSDGKTSIIKKIIKN